MRTSLPIPIYITGHYEGSHLVSNFGLGAGQSPAYFLTLFVLLPFLSEQGPTGSIGPRGQAVSKQ